MKVKYQAVVKWYIDKRKNDEVTEWFGLDVPNPYFKNYDECLESVKKEIKRRENTEQPIQSYRIYEHQVELVVEQNFLK